MLEQTMALLNMDEKDRRLYMAAVELGAQPASVFSRKTGLKRGDTYNHLNKLVKMGVITQFTQRSVQYFDIADLNAIGWLVNEKMKEVKAAQKEINLSEKEKIKMKLGPDWAKVRFYEGNRGVLELMERTITTNKTKELRSLTSMMDFYEIMSWEYDHSHYIPTRVKNGITLKKLVRKSSKMQEMQTRDKNEMREIRYLPDSVDFTATMMCYDDEIVLFGVSKPIFGILVESAELAYFFKTLFDLIWETSRKKA